MRCRECDGWLGDLPEPSFPTFYVCDPCANKPGSSWPPAHPAVVVRDLVAEPEHLWRQRMRIEERPWRP